MRRLFIVCSLLIVGTQAWLSYLYPMAAWSFLVTMPFVLLGIYDMTRRKNTLMRNYPIFGRLRYVMEALRPKIYQYFVESDIDGAPINRIKRSLVYQRAKHVRDTSPFGTQQDVYRVGYEWINHSMIPKDLDDIDYDIRVTVGGPYCKKPYSASLYNISAMSYGALSDRAILSLNQGAKVGGFAHNTGEGAISPFHRQGGGDLIWQIGTGYFGCRTAEGKFNPDLFREKSNWEQVKMIEIKLSQGAKPGHGGILPAEKNTPLIAEIRGVTPRTTVASPSGHSAFCGPEGLLGFIKELRELSGGKPIGFKLCVGLKEEFDRLCYLMVQTGITPDFITVDGGEGGTGAAPVEFADSIGMPLMDALPFVENTLVHHNLRKDIKIFASGKILNGFDMTKAIALGADVCFSARGMMLALGCIQALECNTNHCPTGVATQNPELIAGLDVEDKTIRVTSFHKETMHSFAEILASAGLASPNELKRHHINKRISTTKVMTYAEIYPTVEATRKKISKVL